MLEAGGFFILRGGSVHVADTVDDVFLIPKRRDMPQLDAQSNPHLMNFVERFKMEKSPPTEASPAEQYINMEGTGMLSSSWWPRP